MGYYTQLSDMGQTQLNNELNALKNYLKKNKDLSTKLGESVFAEKLKQALKEAELKKEKQQLEKANEKQKKD